MVRDENSGQSYISLNQWAKAVKGRPVCVSVCLRVYVCVCARARACVCLCVRVCACVCVCVWIEFARAPRVCTRARACECASVQLRLRLLLPPPALVCAWVCVTRAHVSAAHHARPKQRQRVRACASAHASAPVISATIGRARACTKFGAKGPRPIWASASRVFPTCS